jgi:hypothetical protein
MVGLCLIVVRTAAFIDGFGSDTAQVQNFPKLKAFSSSKYSQSQNFF